MIRPGFLDPESRQDLIELTRDGSRADAARKRREAVRDAIAKHVAGLDRTDNAA
jgi:hypothetical protein